MSAHALRLGFGIGFAAAALLVTAGCGKPHPALMIAASTTFQPQAQLVAEAFMQARPGVTVTVEGVDTATSIQAVRTGVAGVGVADFVSLPAAASDLACVVAARDSLAVIVHAANPVTALTRTQVRDIFDGRVRDWSAVGGPAHPINVIVREAGSGTRSSFEELLGGPSTFANVVLQDTSGALRRTVASDPHAIGYVSGSLLDASVKAVSVDGAACTPAEVIAERYPLVRRICILTRPEPTALARDFVAFLRGPEGLNLLKGHDLVPVP